MKTKIPIYFSILATCLLLATACVSSKFPHSDQVQPSFTSSTLPPPSKSGECYVRYTTKDMYQVNTKEYIIYTGDAAAMNKSIEKKTILLQPKKGEWVKKKKSKDCYSSNPHDCIVACYEETPEITREINIVKDTNLIKDYRIEKISQKYVVKKGGEQGWIKTICREKLTLNYINRLQSALQENGFYTGTLNGELSIETMKGLKAYQSANNLRVGYLDVDSMRSLGL